MNHQTRLLHLLQEHAVQTGTFVLKSQRPSSWFIDVKQVATRPEGMLAIADALLDVLPPETDAIGGLTMGADPIAFGVAGIAATRGVSLRSFSIRQDAKAHGVEGRVAGALLPGDRAVVIEDVATRGASILEAARVVKAAGARVLLLVALVDRGGTAQPLAAQQGMRFCALITAHDLGLPYEGAAIF